VNSFGLAAFLGLLVLWLRQPPERRREKPFAALFLYSAFWFALNLTAPGYHYLLAAACAFPALLCWLFLAPAARWLAAAGALLAALCLLQASGALSVGPALTITFCLLLASSVAISLPRNPGGLGNAAVLGGGAVVVPLALYSQSDWLGLVMRSLPLVLLLADTYSRRRFIFLDLFVKWGSYFLLALLSLSAWFALAPRNLHPVQSALLAAPLLWAVPYVCRKWGRWLDRHWLGRPMPPGEAERFLLQRLQNAADEESLKTAAQSTLASIFHTPFSIGVNGEIRLIESPSGPAIYSGDLELAASLSTLLAFLIENRRLDERRRRLAVEASRAELKALRAQVNPHFLFNALNTVAGLTHSNPELAEQTVERLADVFRYTLSRSENEWSTVNEELLFVRAYLDVEAARFGTRLQAAIDATPSALPARIPALVLQTLVENAIKHGVARSRDSCRVLIRVSLRDQRLLLEVLDTGAGPVSSEGPGHGLKNIRERLRGYYGEHAALQLVRDEARGETVASIEVPV
jgi:hypothetical protein